MLLWYNGGAQAMVYSVQIGPDAVTHLRALAARGRALLLDAIGEQLAHNPTEETRWCDGTTLSF